MRLLGRNIVVAGAGPGLGAAVVRKAVAEGAKVLAISRRGGHVERGGNIFTAAYDLSKEEQAVVAAREARRIFPSLHGLVVTAGGYVRGGINEVTEADLEDMVAKNLKAHIWTVKAFLDLLEKGSSIVLVTSVGGPIRKWPRHIAYISTKAATAALAEALAAELLERGIRVNVVAPGGMDPNAREPELGAAVAPPEYVADVVIWLLTDEARWVTGAVIPVDGGRRLLSA